MQWDTITDQWLWFSAAAVFLVLFGALAAYYFYKPKAHDATKPYDTIRNQQDGWIPTGRVDFFDRQSIDNFILHVEETRIVDSTGSVEHCEIRWRTATLEEADSVLVAYHAQRNLVMAPNYIVTSSNVLRRNADVQNEHQDAQPKKNGVSGAQPEEYPKPDGGATNVLPKASSLINPA
jgi:hypothetical protein